MDYKEIEEMCGWLKNTKRITKIELTDLVEYIPEYKEYLKINN